MEPTPVIPASLSKPERVQEQHVDEAACLIAEAFLDSPGYKYAFSELTLQERREALVWLFSKNIRIRLESGAARCVFVRQPGKRDVMVCFFMLELPNTPDISIWTMIMNGIIWLPFRYGLSAFRRLLEIKGYAENAEIEFFNSEASRKCPPSSFCRLERMVVHPSYQGQGIGSQSLRAALDKVTSERNLGCVLSTWEERNVRFYSRLGFQVASRDDSYVGGTNWVMFKSPQ